MSFDKGKMKEKNYIKHYITKYTVIGKLMEMLSKINEKRTDKK